MDHRHDAGGGEGDAALGECKTVAIRKQEQRVADIVVIVERLALAHHDDVGDEAAFGGNNRAVRRVAVGEIAEPVTGDQQLRDDFLGGKVAHQLLRAGVAEGTGERAADL